MKKLSFITLILCFSLFICSCMVESNHSGNGSGDNDNPRANGNYDNSNTDSNNDSSSADSIPDHTVPMVNAQIEIIDEYKPLLYEESVGVGGDFVTERYFGEKFFNMEKYEKSNQEKKTEDAFGSHQAIKYGWTLKSDELAYEIDEYSYVKNRNSIYASYRADTNKIVKYKRNASHNREYESPVNPHSSENEYISYAKMIFSQYAGIVLDDWEVTIQTWRAEYGYEDKFINYFHEIPAYNAEYTITFSKKISGIDRCDKLYVCMTNVGEIIEFNAVDYDQSFAPYANVQIDRAKIEEAAWQAFRNIRNSHNVFSESIESVELITQSGSLWAQVKIEYSVGETRGGVIYVMEVARLI